MENTHEINWFKVTLLSLAMMMAFSLAKCYTETAHAAGLPAKVDITLYTEKGEYIMHKEARGEVGIKIGHALCLFKYNARGMKYVTKCKIKDVTAYQGESSCRRNDPQRIYFNIGGKAEKGSRKYYFRWRCIPRRVI